MIVVIIIIIIIIIIMIIILPTQSVPAFPSTSSLKSENAALRSYTANTPSTLKIE